MDIGLLHNFSHEKIMIKIRTQVYCTDMIFICSVNIIPTTKSSKEALVYFRIFFLNEVNEIQNLISLCFLSLIWIYFMVKGKIFSKVNFCVFGERGGG